MTLLLSEALSILGLARIHVNLANISIQTAPATPHVTGGLMPLQNIQKTFATFPAQGTIPFTMIVTVRTMPALTLYK